MATPYFYINPPFSGLSPLSSKKFRPLPLLTQFSEGPNPLPLISGGSSNYVQFTQLNPPFILIELS